MSLALDDYQDYASQTAEYPVDAGLGYTILGLCGEAGEVANRYKKILRVGGGMTPQRKVDLVDELGDVLWYVAMVARELGVPLSEVAARNINKLSERKETGSIKTEDKR